MRLIDKVAEALTPQDALQSVRDWLEDAGQPVSAMLLHREVSDTASGKDFFFGEDALERAHEEGFTEGFEMGRAKNPEKVPLEEI
jgi:hypothetical protein